ncbi:hypothetical protein C8Q77DRAFT_474477 [Trametes polyzona]|nr:hypothetical protein C8Q77DRAFT_474477 [Trametes polyzona]
MPNATSTTMHDNRSTTQPMPIDLIFHIIDDLSGDQSSLSKCALTSSAIFPRARAGLYRSISLTSLSNARLLCRTLDEDPSLGALVESLAIVDSDCQHAEEPRPWHFCITPELLPFHHLTSLCDFSIAPGVSLGSPRDLVEIASQLAPEPVPPNGSLCHVAFKRIKVTSYNWDHRILAAKLLQGLHTLAVSVIDPDPSDVPIHVSRWTLELANRHEGGHKAYLWDTIARCSHLRFLHLHHTPPSSPFRASSDFMSLLNTLLERHPVPFPALQHLSMRMVDRDGGMVYVPQESSRRLAESLLDKLWYPSFSALTLRVQPQRWSYGLREWSSMRMGVAAIEALARASRLVERWGLAFEAFQQHPFVRLEIIVERAETRAGLR